jgi:thioredoxin-dependent peroxiredoxin
MLQPGDLFPNFALRDQDGNLVTLESLKGSRTLIYFYPKDDTSGCTAQACAFRDGMEQMDGVRVIGVSPDSVASHRKFADKYSLPFPLLADTDRELAQAAGVWVEKSMYGRSYMGVERTTFLLDEEGRIVEIFRKVKVPGHLQEILQALK